MRKMKKGVSLVTVLLFMMVATIAATATYKWLSSVGSSSAARLQISEARQAALSGIEAAQSWMTFNGNDLGAVIKQYFENEKKPILLNSVLPRMSSNKMLDSVWLMGVNVESSSRYKIKIVSQGTTRENVKYSEVAIFNVSGLYQAEIPTETYNVKYKDAFHGSLATADVIDVTSAFIKQTPAMTHSKGQALNSVRASEYLVLDGNFYVNNSGNVKDLYVTGDLSFLNSLNVSRNLYVGGTVYGTSTASHMNVFGSSYLNGGMRVNNRSSDVINNNLYTPGEDTGGKFDFYGNVTSNGNIDHFNADASASYIEMHKNLVLNGRLVFPSSASSNSYYIHVARNAFIRDNSTTTGNIGTNYLSKTVFGSNVDDSLYLAEFVPHSGNNDCGSQFNCAKSTNENIYVTYNGKLISMPLPERYSSWNADDMATYREMFTEEKDDCGSYSVSKDRLQFNEGILSLTSTAGVSLVHSANAKHGCSEEIWNDDIDAPVKALNACFNVANNANMLVDKTWLIVSWDHAPKWSSTSEKLSGNFIFVIDATSAPAAEFELPETNDDAKVLIYLPNGWDNKSSEHSLKTKGSSNARSNYFVYSKGDIGGFNMQISPLNGSIYMQGCSQLNTLKDNNTLAVRFNENLFKSLVKSSILCESDGTGSCSPFVGSVSGFAGIDPYQTTDPYHIATSPQLIVEVESQYKNTEPLPQNSWDYTAVAPSEVVLPRIIYLPRDARGRFSDYYNVVGLNYKNGLKASKDPSLMQCSGAIPTGNSLLTSGGELTEGKYLCGYGDKGKQVPVYVVVEGSLNENAIVQFHDDDVEKKISPGNSTKVRLVATESDVPMTVTISVDLPEDGSWHVEPAHSNLEYHSDLGVYKLTTTSSGGDVSIPVFDVKSDLQNAAAGVYFHIVECEKCFPGNNQHAHVFTKNIATVERKGIVCSEIDEDQFKQKYDVECSDMVNMPACDNSFLDDDVTWVTARGLGCVPTTRNVAWECRTGGNEVNLESVLSTSAFCTAYIPPVSVQLKNPDSVYKLPAVLKRKLDTLVVKIIGASVTSTGSVKIEYKRRENGSVSSDDMNCSGDLCKYALFAGDTVYLSREGGKFSYWTCNGKSCTHEPDETYNELPTKLILVGGRDSVTAWFGQKDAHCFYTNFKDFKSDGWCSASDIENDIQCLDKCKSGSNIPCSVSQDNYGGTVENSDWLMVYPNDGSGFKIPVIKNRDGYMSSPDEFGKRILLGTVTGKPSVMLNRAKAGSDGLMTSLLNIQEPESQVLQRIGEWIGFGELLINDGLIFRSNANATEYFTFYVVSHWGGFVYGRLCYVSGQYNDENSCYDIRFKKGVDDNLSEWFESDKNRLTLNLDIKGSVIKAVLSKNDLTGGNEHGFATAVFDLENNSDLKRTLKGKILDDDAHQYVGIKIGYPYIFKLIKTFILSSFEIFDIGWRSYDYEENCWDVPMVSCSFKANYIGGMVPDSTDVTPWVGMSSWFENKDCSVSYYYNGCDVRSDKFLKMIPKDRSYRQIFRNADGFLASLFYNFDNEIACPSDGSSGKGLYNFSSRKLMEYDNLGSLNSDKYWFEKEGYHGYPIETSRSKGYINEASVIVSCKRSSDNYNTHIYDAGCGDFIVGEYERCSESFSGMLDPSSGYCSAGNDDCVVNLAGTYNVREATVSFSLSSPISSKLQAYLVDVDGITSALANVEKVGEAEYKIDVASVSDAPGFNPQKLHSILFKNVSQAFDVNRVWSYCRYEFSVTCEGASYNFGSTSWTVSASVVNPDRAEGGCEIVLIADGNEVSGTRVSKPCSESFVQDFEHEIYGQSVTHTYSFKVLARDGNGDELDACTTEEKTINPLEIQCYVNNSLDLQYVPQGIGVPPFSFSVANCPPEGCPYTLRYPSGFGLNPETDVVISSEDPIQIHPSGSVNTPENKLSKGDYEYQLDVMGHSCPSGNVFEVIGEPEKGTCTEKKVERDDDGREYFVANIDFEGGTNSYWNGTVMLVYTDVLGNIMQEESVSFERQGNHTLKYELPEGMASCSQGVCNYIVTLKLYGDQECSVEWKARKIQVAEGSGCLAASITNQDPSSAISFTPSVSGCEDGNCNWTLKGEGVDVRGSGYNGSSTLSFSDSSAAGTRTYQFSVFAQDELTSSKADCNFNVTFAADATDVSECYFEDAVDWGGEAKYLFTTNCANCSYNISGAGYGGVTGRANDRVEAKFNVYKNEDFGLTINGKKIDKCSIKPNFKPIKVTCAVGKQQLYADESTTFTASFDVCKDNSGCDWTWEIRKNEGNATTGNVVESGSVNSKNSISQTIKGGGTYTLYLNGEKADCDEQIIETVERPESRIESCSFAKTEYNYNEGNVEFDAFGVMAYNETWTISKVGSSSIQFNHGSGLTKDNGSFSTYGENGFKVTRETAGSYKFELSSGASCIADLNLKQKSLTCTKNGSKIYVQATGCENGCKLHYKRTDKNSDEGTVTITSNKEITVSKSSKKYKVYLDGESGNAVDCASGSAPTNPTVGCTLSKSSGYTVTISATRCDNGCNYILYKGTSKPTDYDAPSAYPEIIRKGTIKGDDIYVSRVGDNWFRVVIVENGSEIAVGTCK